jgi:hypothetical protein
MRDTTLATMDKRPGITDEFIRVAGELDRCIAGRIVKIERDWTEMAVECSEFLRRGYYRALINPATGAAFVSGREWAEFRFLVGRAQMFRLVGIVRELLGDVGKENLREMSQANAELLARIPKEKRTVQVVAAATELPKKEFQTVVAQMLPPEEAQEVIYHLGPFAVHRDVHDQFSSAVDLAKRLVQDGDRSRTLLEKALEAIAVEFITTHQDEHDIPVNEKRGLNADPHGEEHDDEDDGLIDIGEDEAFDPED